MKAVFEIVEDKIKGEKKILKQKEKEKTNEKRKRTK